MLARDDGGMRKRAAAVGDERARAVKYHHPGRRRRGAHQHFARAQLVDRNTQSLPSTPDRGPLPAYLAEEKRPELLRRVRDRDRDVAHRRCQSVKGEGLRRSALCLRRWFTNRVAIHAMNMAMLSRMTSPLWTLASVVILCGCADADSESAPDSETGAQQS